MSIYNFPFLLQKDVFQGVGFSGFRFFRIHVFHGPGFNGPSLSGFKFLRVQVFVGSGFSGSRFFRVWAQVLEVVICYNYSFFYNFVLIHFRCPLGALKKTLNFRKHSSLVFGKNTLFFIRTRKELMRLNVVIIIIIIIIIWSFSVSKCSYFVLTLYETVLILLGYFNTTPEEFKGNAQFIFLCNPQKFSVNVCLIKNIKKHFHKIKEFCVRKLLKISAFVIFRTSVMVLF